jgi:hypothetical protein
MRGAAVGDRLGKVWDKARHRPSITRAASGRNRAWDRRLGLRRQRGSAMLAGAMRRGATFDPSMRFRYALWRTWDARGRRVAFVMLNPSTADKSEDDPTIRRCMGLARDRGFGKMWAVNLFGYRTPTPGQLRRVPDPIGPDNDRHLRAVCGRADVVIAAWGVHGALMGRDRVVAGWLARRRRPVLCFGTTKAGHPRHPLYLPRDAPLEPYRGADTARRP